MLMNIKFLNNATYMCCSDNPSPQEMKKCILSIVASHIFCFFFLLTFFNPDILFHTNSLPPINRILNSNLDLLLLFYNFGNSKLQCSSRNSNDKKKIPYTKK